MRLPAAALLLLLCCFTCGSEGARPTLRKRSRSRQAGRPAAQQPAPDATDATTIPNAVADAAGVAGAAVAQQQQQPSAADGFTTAAVTATYDVIVVGAGLAGLKVCSRRRLASVSRRLSAAGS
jgi:hypothetical protein